MRLTLSTVLMTTAVMAFAAGPASAQGHGGGGHGGGRASGGHAGGGQTTHGVTTHAGGGTHANPRQHVTPPPPVVRSAVPRATGVRPHVDRPVVVRPDVHLGIGALGLGAGGYAYPYGYGYGYNSYGNRYPGTYGYGARNYGGYARNLHARLRILGAPHDAQVYVDGYYAGIANDFDGILQHLELTPGPHQIEIRANGFAPVVFDVRAESGRTITYRAQMIP